MVNEDGIGNDPLSEIESTYAYLFLFEEKEKTINKGSDSILLT